MTILINLFGSSCSGKSTTALGLGYQLRLLGYKVENINEWIKDEIFANNLSVVEDQLYIFAQQRRKQFILQNKGLDFIVTDSPLLLSAFYGEKYNTSDVLLNSLVTQEFSKFNNVNFFLERTVPFDPCGRLGNQEGSDKDSINMKGFLSRKSINYFDITESEKTQQILKILNNLGYSI